jgi:5-(carboxyamino)imidazole ribonucleotide synthase
VTLNVLGEGDAHDPRAGVAAGLLVPGAHIHLYGKGARPGRKVGHVTVVGDDAAAIEDTAQAASDALFGRTATPGGTSA